MDNTVTISTERYAQLVKAEVALSILVENQYAPDLSHILSAVARTMKKEDEKC